MHHALTRPSRKHALHAALALCCVPTLSAQPTTDTQTQHTGPVEHVINVRDTSEVVGTIVAASAPAEIKTADDLLLALEHADAGLRTLQGDAMYDRYFDMGGDRQIRRGKVYFESSERILQGVPTPLRRFAVRFTSLQLGAKLMDDEDQTLIFDGRFLIEKHERKKQFTKREIVPEGATFDPLRIGQGPFPLPIGQKRDEILARYDAALLAPTDGVKAHEPEEQAALEAFARGPEGVTTYQLRLTIKPDLAGEDDLREVRLWYREVTMPASKQQDAADAPDKGAAAQRRQFLPCLAQTVSRTGDTSIVTMVNVRLNEALPSEVMATTLPAHDAGWEVSEVWLNTPPDEAPPHAPATAPTAVPSPAPAGGK